MSFSFENFVMHLQMMHLKKNVIDIVHDSDACELLNVTIIVLVREDFQIF